MEVLDPPRKRQMSNKGIPRAPREGEGEDGGVFDEIILKVFATETRQINRNPIAWLSVLIKIPRSDWMGSGSFCCN